MVCLVLLNGCNATNGVVYILVYRTLAAPWRAIYDGGAVVGNAYDGVVIVYKRAALDVLHPFVAVGALALATDSKEHVSLAAILDCCRVHEQCLVWRSAHGEYHHQCVVETKHHVVVAATGGYCEVASLGIALHEGTGYAEFVHRENLVCSVVLAEDFKCRAGAGECTYFIPTPRGLYAVVRCYFEKHISGAVALKWLKVGQQCQYVALGHCDGESVSGN